MKPNPENLLEAVQALIRAEYEHRHGNNPYCVGSEDRFEEAITSLREVATGERDLRKAAATLGKKNPGVVRLRLPNRLRTQQDSL